MYSIFHSKRMICRALCIFIALIGIHSNAHETAAQYELQPISLPTSGHEFSSHLHPTYPAPATILSVLAACTQISCGPVSCSIPALVGAVYYTYQWWKHRKQAQSANDTAQLTDQKNTKESIGEDRAPSSYLLLMQRTVTQIALSKVVLMIVSEIDGHPVRFDVLNSFSCTCHDKDCSRVHA